MQKDLQELPPPIIYCIYTSRSLSLILSTLLWVDELMSPHPLKVEELPLFFSIFLRLSLVARRRCELHLSTLNWTLVHVSMVYWILITIPLHITLRARQWLQLWFTPWYPIVATLMLHDERKLLTLDGVFLHMHTGSVYKNCSISQVYFVFNTVCGTRFTEEISSG